MFSGMTGVVCLPLNQGQVASAGSVTIRMALQCRSVPMISSSRRVVVRSKASRVLTQPESCGTARRAGPGALPVLRRADRPPGARPAAARRERGLGRHRRDHESGRRCRSGRRACHRLPGSGLPGLRRGPELDVIFFGENVPRDQVAECFALTKTASLLPVLGSSLTVQSGYRVVRRATGLGIPVAIINQGPGRRRPWTLRSGRR